MPRGGDKYGRERDLRGEGGWKDAENKGTIQEARYEVGKVRENPHPALSRWERVKMVIL